MKRFIINTCHRIYAHSAETQVVWLPTHNPEISQQIMIKINAQITSDPHR